MRRFMTIRILVLLILLLILNDGRVDGQFTPTTYPDPRTDPLGCRLLLPGQVCDPSEILLPEERRLITEKINRVFLHYSLLLFFIK